MQRLPHMLRTLVAALALLAGPALAQGDDTVAAQFADAARAFTLPGSRSLASTDLASDQAVLATLPSLEGRWLPAHILVPDPTGLDEDLLARHCGRLAAITLERTSNRGFVLIREAEHDGVSRALRIRHDWMIGNTFDRSVEEAEAMAYLGLGPQEEFPTGMLALPSMRGYVAMFHPSPDILVFASQGGGPEILVRCPA